MASEPSADWRPLKIGGSYESRFSTDGRKLVVVGRSISVWDVFGRQKLYRINNPFDNPFDACFSPDDQLIAAKNTSGHIVVLAAATGAVVVDYKNKSEGEGCNVAFSPCGEFLIDGTWGGALTIRRVRNGKIEFQRTTSGTMVHQVSALEGGRKWLIHYAPKARFEGDPPAPDYFEFWTWPFGRAPDAVWQTKHPIIFDTALSYDGKHLAICPGGMDPIAIHDFRSHREVARYRYRRKTIANLAWSADNKTLFAPHDNGVILLRRMKAGVKRVKRIALHMASHVATSPHHNLVALSSWDTGFVVDPETVRPDLLPIPEHMIESYRRSEEDRRRFKARSRRKRT